MLLAIDIGNTNTVIGIFDGATLRDSFRVSSSQTMTSDEAGFFIHCSLERLGVGGDRIKEVIIGSVVPSLTPVFETTAKRYCGCIPTVVSAGLQLPIQIKIDRPDQLGADRIANSVAAYSRYGGPVIVVDFGTSTNFDIVDKEGSFIGGVLCPGPETSMVELAKRAARLFEIRIEKPQSVIGRSTAGALKSGFFYGTIGQVDFILDRIIEEAGFDRPVIVATGGYAVGIQEHSRHIKLVEPDLTLEGLRLIAENTSQDNPG